MQDLNNLNDFYLNKEEDIVIRLQNLDDRSNSISTPEEQQQLKSAFVKLHGEGFCEVAIHASIRC